MGEKREIFCFSNQRFVPSLRTLWCWKTAGAWMGNRHHNYITRGHTPALHQCCSATSSPFYKPPINHSIASRGVLICPWRSQERYFQVLKRNQSITLYISGVGGDYWHTIIYCLTLQELNKKSIETRKSLFEISLSPICDRNWGINTYANKYVRWIITSAHNYRWILLDFHLIHYSMVNTINSERWHTYEIKSQEETLSDQSSMSPNSNKP